MSITPQQAFDALRILDPRIEKIADKQGCLMSYNGMYMRRHYNGNIEWPEGVEQWPPPEPKWTIPTDEDARSRPACRVRDSISDEWLEGGILVHVSESDPPEDYRFSSSFERGLLVAWKFCEIQEQ